MVKYITYIHSWNCTNPPTPLSNRSFRGPHGVFQTLSEQLQLRESLLGDFLARSQPTRLGGTLDVDISRFDGFFGGL